MLPALPAPRVLVCVLTLSFAGACTTVVDRDLTDADASVAAPDVASGVVLDVVDRGVDGAAPAPDGIVGPPDAGSDVLDISGPDDLTDVAPELDVPTLPGDVAPRPEVVEDVPPPPPDVEDPPDPIHPCDGPFVLLEDGGLTVDGVPWRPKIVDYRVELRQDGPTHFLAPHHATCVDNLCCQSAADCAAALDLDLLGVASTGFDAVRLQGLGLGGGDAGDVFDACVQYDGAEGFGPCQHATVDASTAVTILGSFLIAAAARGLRVVLVASGGDVSDPGAHAAVLAELAAPLVDRTELLAWDVGDGAVGGGDAAAAVATWYEALRGATGTQLVAVTVDGSGSLHGWDPALLAVDVVGFRAFPEASWDEPSELAWRSELGWMGSLDVPWWLIETGLATGDVALEVAQHEVAQQSLEVAGACGALAAGWWTYRDGLAEGAGTPQQYGLLRVDGSGKPAAGVFPTVELAPPLEAGCPEVLEPETDGVPVVVTGRVLHGETGKPLPWARVLGTSCPDGAEAAVTFTRADGRFTLLSEVGIMQIVITASGFALEDSLWPACNTKDLGDMLLAPVAIPARPGPPACPPG